MSDEAGQVIKTTAIPVPEGRGAELARRFAARAGAVDGQPGFEGFELLRPTDERHTWLVVTRWRDEDAFRAWRESPQFAHGHRSAAERAGGDAPKPVGSDRGPSRAVFLRSWRPCGRHPASVLQRKFRGCVA